MYRKTILLLLFFLGSCTFYFHFVQIGLIQSRVRLIFEDPPYQCCQNQKLIDPPLTNILFLKTHKCASSTIQNIIMRFGVRHSLNFVLPQTSSYIGYMTPFKPSLIPPEFRSSDGKYNILTHHTRYSPALKSVMYSDTKVVTILRQPASVFESTYNYYHLFRAYNKSIKKLIADLPQMRINFRKKTPKKFGDNQMAYDLGLDPILFHNITEIKNLIFKIDREFDLVMIAEYMEVSLILLANLMKWPLHYVASLPMNRRPNVKKYNLTEEEKIKLTRLNNADSSLYNFFLKKFQKCVEFYGHSRMSKDVDRLRHLNQQLKNNCIQHQNVKGFGKTINYVTNSSNWECIYSTKLELSFTKFLKLEQEKKSESYIKLKRLMFRIP